MSDILGISSGAISAYQRALSTVSNNIANVNTEGYSRQEVVLKDTTPRKMAGMYLGTGVVLQNIRRQFDQFAEQNLRGSTSDLSAQAPMVDYTQRVIDIMGDQSVGLNSALDEFFASADALSADPASTVQRTGFLRSADGIASRFAELSSQLEQVGVETRQGMQSVVDQINSYTGQLALINQSLARSPTLEGQPAELLDRRDLTLRQLSELVRIRIGFATNGQVTVGLGSTLNEGLVVSGMNARAIGLDTSAGKTDFVLDPYGKTEALSSLSGGKLGGYQSFATQVLNPARQQLDTLAQVFVNETNTIQKNGIDGYGQIGQDLFGLNPSAAHAAAGMRVALSDGMRVATAAQFRVSEGSSNTSSTRASVRYAGQTPSAALSNPNLVNNPNPSAGVTVKIDGARVYAPVTALSAGVSATFYLDQMAPGQQLQVLTRDGQQILGKSLSETEKYQLLTSANGFNDHIRYSDRYLNQTDAQAYRDGTFFYGAKADVLYQPNYDRAGNALAPTALAASMTSARLTPPLSQVAAGALALNGVSLSGFEPSHTSGLTLSGVSAGSAADFTGFGFDLHIGNQNWSLSAPLTDAANQVPTDAPSLAAALQYQLRLLDGGNDLTVKVLPNGQDLQIIDQAGRAVLAGGFTLDPTQVSADASAGEVQLDGDVAELSRWVNGQTELRLGHVSFGSEGRGFSALQMNLGDVDFDLRFPTVGQPDNPTTLNQLASYLQSALRAKDGSANLSVGVENGQFVLRDRAGRNLKNFTLIPNPVSDPASDAVPASVSQVSITQSHQAQTGVRSELVSEIRVPLNQIDFSKGLSINGQAITPGQDVNALVAAINGAQAGVKAELASDGQLRIFNALGSPITIDRSSNGNALNVEATTYGAQIHLVQVAREMRVPAAEIDLSQVLALNGVQITPGWASYTLPAPDVQPLSLSWDGGAAVTATTPQGLVDALNADAGFAATYRAVLAPGGRLLVQAVSGTRSDDSVAQSIAMRAGGTALTARTGLNTREDLVQRLRDLSPQTGVTAYLDDFGDLMLRTTDAAGTAAISIGPAQRSDGTAVNNALGIEPGDYGVSERLARDLVDHPHHKDIRFSFGADGQPVDLARIGLRTAAYIEHGCADDLLLFVTGQGNAKVAAAFSGTPSDPRTALRAQSLSVKFTAADRYSIIDNATDTVLADRSFDPNALSPTIEFAGLQVQLSRAPAVGDTFRIDGNQDGLGNNVNMLDMAELAKREVVGGKTLHDAYIDQVNDIGNAGQQAKITQQALKVVNDQAVAARDKVSGVNLDNEAADLIRYQQAYQAAAKAMQVSTELFDAIAQIR